MLSHLSRQISFLGIAWRVMEVAFPGSELRLGARLRAALGRLLLNVSIPFILNLSHKCFIIVLFCALAVYVQ